MTSKNEYNPRTAQDVVGRLGSATDEKAAAEETAAGYEEAMKNYESRPDVETLSERRARDGGTSFEDTSFRREVGSVTGVPIVEPKADVKSESKAPAKKNDDK